jgi:hypothetical protein
MLGTADFTATTGTTVVLATGATTGDLIRTESLYVSSVLNAIPATAGSVSSSYIVAGAVGNTQMAAGAALANIGSAGITQTYLATGVAGTGPAFSAYRGSSNQSVSTGTWTKAQLNTEDFDTANCFDSTTNYRFTPTVAGYYQINGSIAPDSSSAFGTGVYVAIYKNGTLYRASNVNNTSAGTASIPCISAVIYFNGSTDYVELYAYFAGGSGMLISTTYNSSSLSGCLVRSA